METVAPPENSAPPSSMPSRRRKGLTVHRWSRWIHVYTSMISLVLVLLFGISGITLNHPTWALGNSTNTKKVTGTFPFTVANNGTVDFLKISEYVRSHNGVGGTVGDYQASSTDGSIAYRGPGYAADLSFKVKTGTYTLTTEQLGWIGVMNDLHKGRDTSTSWKWVIDVSAGLLVLISITGLVMQFFLSKRRKSALTIALVGTVAAIALTIATLA